MCRYKKQNAASSRKERVNNVSLYYNEYKTYIHVGIIQ